jgi:putative ABC transport system permease protein
VSLNEHERSRAGGNPQHAQSTQHPRRRPPPRLAAWLLRRVLPADARGAAILGDLLEEFHATAAVDCDTQRAGTATAAAATARAATWRYWRHAISIGTRYLFIRVTRSSMAVTPREDLPAPRRAPMGFGLLHEDVRYALRGLLRTPTFTLIALATLALGIGASTAIFSLAYTVLVRPLPYPNPDRLVFIAEVPSGHPEWRNGVAWLNFIDWRAHVTSYEELAVSLNDAVNVTGDRPQRLQSRTNTWNIFRVLGAQPVLGRLFTEEDGRADAAPVVVISHELWVSDYGGNPSVIGQILPIERTAHTIIGVLPPGFRYGSRADVWRPLEPLAAQDFRGMTKRGNHANLYAVGRLKPSVTIAQARSEIETLAANLSREYPDTNSGASAALAPLADIIVERYRPTFIVLAGSVALLLLIACVNLANLLLTRGSTRAHELAIRAALGGSRWRIARQLLVEQGLLIAAGVALGAITGSALLELLIALAPRDVPRLDEVRLNDGLLLYTAAASGLCALAFGFIPAFKASSVRGQELLVRAGRTAQLSTTRMRRGLMIAEVGVATILLVGSGLMVQTMLRLTQSNPGFDTRNLLTLNIDMKIPTWPAPKRQATFASIVERLRALPGVENAGLTLSLPMDGIRWGSQFILGDRPVPPPSQLPGAAFTPVSTGYFEMMKIPLVRGRLFDRTDGPDSAPVAIINETVARAFWPGRDPIGQRLKQGFPGDPNLWRMIVGVVGDVKTGGLDIAAPTEIYLPIAHARQNTWVVVVRGEHVDRMAGAVTAALREFDKDLPIFGVKTMDEVMSNANAQKRVSMVVLSVFGLVAVLLAMIGLYGVITYCVTERTQEIGVRMALGATGGQVLRLFLRQGIIAAACGIAVGVAVAIWLTRWLETLLFGVTATDVPTFAAVVAILLVVAIAASYIPARRAARVDPLTALRCE